MCVTGRSDLDYRFASDDKAPTGPSNPCDSDPFATYDIQNSVIFRNRKACLDILIALGHHFVIIHYVVQIPYRSW